MYVPYFSYIQCIPCPEDLDFLDVFGGQASISKGFSPCLSHWFEFATNKGPDVFKRELFQLILLDQGASIPSIIASK